VGEPVSSTRVGFAHGTGWEADDRQGDGAGMPARRAGPVVSDDRAAFRGLPGKISMAFCGSFASCALSSNSRSRARFDVMGLMRL